MKQYKPKRWAYKHGAYYYRVRDDERELFDGKSWFWLGTSYPDALRAYADRIELATGKEAGGLIDRYRIEELPKLKPNTQRSYGQSLERLRKALGHNSAALITPQVMYQYMDALIKKGRSMNVANNDLKVVNVLFDCAVRWGVLPKNHVKGETKPFGKRQGLKKERDRYVQDWELEEWQKEASEIQKAFAAIVMLTGARKADTLRILLSDDRKDYLRILNSKTGKESRFRWTPALREAVDMAKATRQGKSLFLFENRNGECFVNNKDECKPFDKAWVRSMDRAIADPENKLQERFTRHDLRAKVGSDAENDHRAQLLLGHTSVSMTKKHYRRKVVMIDPVR